MRRALATDLFLGALAGAAATWLMDVATTAIQDQHPESVKKREKEAYGGKSAYEKAEERFGIDDQVIHWSLGVTSGVIYGALRHAMPSMRYGSGLAFGTGFWLAMDEAALTLLGLAPPPQEFPWQTHARGLAGHLVLGGTIESVFDVADLVASRK